MMSFNRQTPAVYPNINVVFHGIPKNASTTIKNALYELEHGHEFENDNKQFIHKGNEKGGSIYPRPDQLQHSQYDTYYHIAVCRNPYTRFKSFYLDLFEGAAEKRTSLPKFYTHHNISMRMDVDKVIDMIEQYDDQSGDEHFISQHTYIYRDLSEIYCIPIELLTEYWSEFCQNCLNIDPPTLKIYNTTSTLLDLTKTQKRRIYDRYQQDFEVFEYAR